LTTVHQTNRVRWRTEWDRRQARERRGQASSQHAEPWCLAQHRPNQGWNIDSSPKPARMVQRTRAENDTTSTPIAQHWGRGLVAAIYAKAPKIKWPRAWLTSFRMRTASHPVPAIALELAFGLLPFPSKSARSVPPIPRPTSFSGGRTSHSAACTRKSTCMWGPWIDGRLRLPRLHEAHSALASRQPYAAAAVLIAPFPARYSGRVWPELGHIQAFFVSRSWCQLRSCTAIPG